MKTLLCILCFSFILLSDEVLITNSSTTTLRKDEVKKIYLGKQKLWNDGSKIALTLSTANGIEETFMKNYLKKKYSQYLIYWKQLLYTGRGKMPQTFESDEKLILYMVKNEGAIGFISKESVADLPPTITIIEVVQ